MALVGLWLAAAALPWGLGARPPQDDRAAEQRLIEYINDTRRNEGLPPVPLSRALTRVARAHVHDLMEQRPDSGSDRYGRRCTMHSWSGAGSWTPVCYTPDDAHAQAMWDKPREITRQTYQGDGVEIAYRMGGGVTPEIAIDGWLGSPRHAVVIVEHGVWRNSNWQAMGVAIYGDYAVAWFSKEPDSTR